MKSEPEDYNDPLLRQMMRDIQNPATGMADSIDQTALEMLHTLLHGPKAWAGILPPEIDAESARLLVRLGQEDEEVRAINGMTWLQSQQLAICNLIGRRFYALEIWAVEAGRLDLLVSNRKLIEEALRRG
jgi:hypothetical protein